MTEVELLDAFLELARELALEVRVVGGRQGRRPGTEAEPPVASAICRVRGQLWVVLSAADPVGRQISLLARALQLHAGAALEERFLPPALRLRLAEVDPGGGSGAG